MATLHLGSKIAGRSDFLAPEDLLHDAGDANAGAQVARLVHLDGVEEQRDRLRFAGRRRPQEQETSQISYYVVRPPTTEDRYVV